MRERGHAERGREREKEREREGEREGREREREREGRERERESGRRERPTQISDIRQTEPRRAKVFAPADALGNTASVNRGNLPTLGDLLRPDSWICCACCAQSGAPFQIAPPATPDKSSIGAVWSAKPKACQSLSCKRFATSCPRDGAFTCLCRPPAECPLQGIV